jgi:hypothetical protein
MHLSIGVLKDASRVANAPYGLYRKLDQSPTPQRGANEAKRAEAEHAQR